MANFFSHQFHCIDYHRQHFMVGPWPDYTSIEKFNMSQMKCFNIWCFGGGVFCKDSALFPTIDAQSLIGKIEKIIQMSVIKHLYCWYLSRTLIY